MSAFRKGMRVLVKSRRGRHVNAEVTSREATIVREYKRSVKVDLAPYSKMLFDKASGKGDIAWLEVSK